MKMDPSQRFSTQQGQIYEFVNSGAFIKSAGNTTNTVNPSNSTTNNNNTTVNFPQMLQSTPSFLNAMQNRQVNSNTSANGNTNSNTVNTSSNNLLASLGQMAAQHQQQQQQVMFMQQSTQQQGNDLNNNMAQSNEQFRYILQQNGQPTQQTVMTSPQMNPTSLQQQQVQVQQSNNPQNSFIANGTFQLQQQSQQQSSQQQNFSPQMQQQPQQLQQQPQQMQQQPQQMHQPQQQMHQPQQQMQQQPQNGAQTVFFRMQQQPSNSFVVGGTHMMTQPQQMSGQFVQQQDGSIQFIPYQTFNPSIHQGYVYDPSTNQTNVVFSPQMYNSQPVQMFNSPYRPFGVSLPMSGKHDLNNDQKQYSSKYRGVSWHRRDRKWLARTWINGRIEHLGCFRSEDMAALAVDIRTIEHFGSDCKDLNFSDPEKRAALKSKFKENGEFKLRSKEALMNPIPRSNRRTKLSSSTSVDSTSQSIQHAKNLDILSNAAPIAVLAASAQKKKRKADDEMSDGSSSRDGKIVKKSEEDSDIAVSSSTTLPSVSETDPRLGFADKTLVQRRRKKVGCPSSPTASSGSWSGSGVSVHTDEMSG